MVGKREVKVNGLVFDKFEHWHILPREILQIHV